MRGKRIPRLGCFVVEGIRFEITDLGLAQIEQLSSIGARVAEIAQYLNISRDWLDKALDAENAGYRPEVDEAFNKGAIEFKRRLLAAQANLAESNAQMAIHLGKHHLGQDDRPQEINHNIRVVGTLPDYSSSADDWKRQFAPSVLQGVEPPKRDNVVDAEVVKE